MHIAFLTPEYPHSKVLRSAGIGSSIKNLADALVTQNHKVSVFIFGQKDDAVFEDNGITCHLIKTKRYKFLGWYLQRKHIQKYINKRIKAETIDVLEAPDWTGITAFMTLKCPIVIRCHGTDAYFCQLENRPQKKKNFFLENKALHNANHILSESRFNAQLTSSIFSLKKEITVIHNGVDTERFKASGKYILGTVLYFGTIIRKKGVLELPHILNKVIAEYPQMTFKIAGKDAVDSFEKSSTKELMLTEMSDALKAHTQWLGELSYNAMQEEISKAHIVVLPSFAEAFPMTWLEAMAAQKALVTSNIGWAQELMINEDTGFMEDPKNHEAYAQRILQLLKDTDLCETLGLNARKRILEAFTANQIATENINFYKSIVTN